MAGHVDEKIGRQTPVTANKEFVGCAAVLGDPAEQYVFHPGRRKRQRRTGRYLPDVEEETLRNQN